jgi:hypothetical protein
MALGNMKRPFDYGGVLNLYDMDFLCGGSGPFGGIAICDGGRTASWRNTSN